MPKIFVDDYKNVIVNSNEFDIYPVDYEYIVDYIIDNVEMKNNRFFCYCCGDTITDMMAMSDFEITFLTCGHLHHTACLLSNDTYNMNVIVQKCVYCNSNSSLDVIKKSLEKTYYACILAYDMKNPDYISKFSDFSQKCQTQEKCKTKKKTDSEIINIKIKVKEETAKPVLRRSVRLIEKNNRI